MWCGLSCPFGWETAVACDKFKRRLCLVTDTKPLFDALRNSADVGVVAAIVFGR
jgi:hypothetical protein